MGRFAEYEDDGDGIPSELYWRNFEKHLRARGQKMLLEVEAALLELPTKRLIYGALAQDGEVCGVGAYIVRRRVAAGEDRETVIAEMCKHAAVWNDGVVDPTEYDDSAARNTVDEAVKHGLSKMLAWSIESDNDEDYGALTPEARYDRVLARVRGLIERSQQPLPFETKKQRQARLADAQRALTPVAPASTLTAPPDFAGATPGGER